MDVPTLVFLLLVSCGLVIRIELALFHKITGKRLRDLPALQRRRFGLALAILIVGGALSVWAFGNHHTAIGVAIISVTFLHPVLLATFRAHRRARK